MEVFYYNTKVGTLQISCGKECVCEIIKVKKNEGEESRPIYEENNAIFAVVKQQLDEYFCGERKTFDFKFELIGTEFQKKVWSELQKIPYGKTCTYQEIAKRIGNEKATRAVGNANGKNPMTIVVPCHRVVSKNGIGGYSSGIDMKENLLIHECTNS